MLRGFRFHAACVLGLTLSSQVYQGLGVSDAPGQSEQPKPRKVYTNQDLEELRERRPINQGARQTPAAAGTSQSISDYRDLNGHGRAHWQKKVKPLLNRLASLESQIAALRDEQQRASVTQGLKVTRKGKLQSTQDRRQVLSKRIGDLEQKKAEVVRLILELEDEARKVQALPEWLR